MSVRLLILGLLERGPLHGYELKRIITTEMGDWTNVAVGSIYFALDKLAAEGFIQAQETTREGGRPERTVYAITETGRAEFFDLLRRTWAEVGRQVFPLDIGIAFMDRLPSGDLELYLRNRLEILEGILHGLGRHESETIEDPEVPQQARLIFAHHVAHYKAEIAWTREALQTFAGSAPRPKARR